MTIGGAIAELQNLLKADDVPFYYKGGIQKVIETIQMDIPKQVDDLISGADDLIRRADAIDVLIETIAPPSMTLDTLVMRIDAIPSAQPKQGEWIDDGVDYVCSVCKTNFSDELPYITNGMPNYCPNCGAMMTANADQHVQRVEYVENDEISRCWICKHFERMYETPISSDGSYYTYVVCTAKECHYEPKDEPQTERSERKE